MVLHLGAHVLNDDEINLALIRNVLFLEGKHPMSCAQHLSWNPLPLIFRKPATLPISSISYIRLKGKILIFCIGRQYYSVEGKIPVVMT